MALKGAAPDYDGEPPPTAGRSTDELSAVAGRWGIDPARDLVKASARAAPRGRALAGAGGAGWRRVAWATAYKPLPLPTPRRRH